MPKKVYQYNLNNELLKIWDSAKAAANELNIAQGNISACCNNKRKTVNNYIWKYENNDDLPNETWIELIDYDLNGLFVSNLGRYYNNTTKNKSFGKIGKNKNTIEISYNKKIYQLGRLILLGFIGYPPSDKHIASHINLNPCDNSINNLKWDLPGKNPNINLNIAKRSKTKTRKISQLKDNQIINVFDSVKQICDIYNISESCIYACINNRQKSSCGYQWKYEDQLDLINEEWKEHPILKIQISNKGRVLSKYGKTYGSLQKSNYYTFNSIFVHRLVAETFLENIENKPTIDHIDRNTKNNYIENLRWATHKEQNYNKTYN